MVVRLRKDKQFRFMKVCNQPQEAKNASFRQRSFPALSSYKFFAFFMIRFRETNFQDNHKTHFRTFFSRSWSLGVLSPPINLFFNTHLSLLKRKKKLFEENSAVEDCNFSPFLDIVAFDIFQAIFTRCQLWSTFM